MYFYKKYNNKKRTIKKTLDKGGMKTMKKLNHKKKLKIVEEETNKQSMENEEKKSL